MSLLPFFRSPIILILAAAFSASALVACGSPGDGAGSGDVSANGLGTVGLKLQVSGVTLNEVEWGITGNGFEKRGAIDVSKSRKVSAVIGGIPEGDGYTLTLSASDAADSTISCGGSAQFNVRAGATTAVSIQLRCTLPGGAGSIAVSAETNICPRIDALSVQPAEARVGESMALSALVTDRDQRPHPASYAWAASGGAITAESSPEATFTCTAAGVFTLSLAVSDGDCEDAAEVEVECSAGADVPPAPPLVRVNEVESNGGVPGDWTELYNAGPANANISGFIFKDNDDSHAYAIPRGTVVAPGAYYLIEEAAQGFGLGGADSVRLFDASGVAVDSYTWSAHAALTYARCPDGTGAFAPSSVVTKGAANQCAPVTPPLAVWPGENDVQTVDVSGEFTSNLSGLTYEPAKAGLPAVLWAVVNGPGTLFRLVWDGAAYVPDATDDFAAGKALHYPNGLGNPDSESVTFGASAADGIYVATERNNDASTVSRLSILRFDASRPGPSLTATHEWNVTADIPAVGANLGLEAITWIPDSFLVAHHFYDEAKLAAYAPSSYPNHGDGLFFVGVEATGVVYGYALDHVTSGFARVATIATHNPGVMGLEFDREVGYLWASCDDSCGNRAAVLQIDAAAGSATSGRFRVSQDFARPISLPDVNNEGIAIAPESECQRGFKPFFWSDDNATGGFSLRRDSIPCGAFLDSRPLDGTAAR